MLKIFLSIIIFFLLFYSTNIQIKNQKEVKKDEILQTQVGMEEVIKSNTYLNNNSHSNSIIIIYIFILLVLISLSIKKREKKTNEKLQKEKIKNKFIEEKIGIASHYLKEPLQGMIISLDKISTNSNEKIKNEVESMNNIIIDLSKQIDEILNSFKSDLNLNNIIKNSILSTIKEFKQHNINIEYKEKDSYKINGDKSDLEMVISILLKNAVRALSHIDKKIVTIEIIERDFNYIIYVRDNGDGINLKDINKIFEKGFTTKSDDKEGGLGLYFAKETINYSFNGKIRVHNNNGAIFEIILPKDY